MNTAKARVLELLDAGAYGILKSDDVSLKTSNILELDRLVPEDWMYRAEGNANMCFSYIGPDTRLVRTVLRLRKCMVSSSDAISNEGTIHEYDPALELFYRSKIIAPLLGKEYIGCMRLVRLNRSFLCALAAKAEPLRPEKRRIKTINVDQPYGLLTLDHAAFATTDTEAIALEIKPKWGFLPDPTSPYARTLHPAKLKTCRYCMHQYLKKLQKSQTSDQSGQDWKHSEYCPLDLFSGDRVRVRRALTALAQCPQNNMRIWITSQRTRHEAAAGSSAYHHLLPLGESCLTPFLNHFLDMATDILLRENLLERLCRHQKQLDEPGIETILRCYEQLREQNGNSLRKPRRADTTIPIRIPTTREEMIQVWHMVLNNYQRRQRLAESSVRITRNMSMTLRFSSQLHSTVDTRRISTSPTQASVDISDGSDVSDGVNEASMASNERKLQRLLRLHEYLLSATLKDCTILVTIGKAHSKNKLVPLSSNHYLTENIHTFTYTPPNPTNMTDTNGTILSNEPCRVYYKINIIDLDMKPAERIPHYYALDAKILKAYLESDDQHCCV